MDAHKAIKYNKDDVDLEGNTFPSLMFKNGESEIKHIIEEEYPCVIGLHTGDSIFENELAFMQKFQLPIIQPYAAFFGDRVKIWNCFPPATFNAPADAEMLYSDITEWKDL